MIDKELLGWTLTGLGVLIGLASWAIKLLLGLDKRMAIFESWQRNHEVSDEHRHEENLNKFDRIFEILDRPLWRK